MGGDEDSETGDDEGTADNEPEGDEAAALDRMRACCTGCSGKPAAELLAEAMAASWDAVPSSAPPTSLHARHSSFRVL